MSDASAQDNAPRPFCLGRYLIDLPPDVDAFLPSASAEYRFGTIKTERVQMTSKEFAERMEKREAKIKNEGFERVYRWTKTLSINANTQIFLGSRNAFGSTAYAFEAYYLDKDVLFSMSEAAYAPKDIDSVLTELQTRLLPSLRARAPDEIPTEPGLCIADGFIASDGSEKALEDVRIRLDSKRWPELFMSVVHHTVHTAEPFLLERMNRAEVPAELVGMLAQVKRIRKGRHDVGPITGEESMVLLPADHGIRNFAFRWESHFALDDPFKPMIVIQLKTDWEEGGGKPVPKISEKDAVQLFDAIVNSIRLRPTGPATRSETPTPKTPLGELAVTGRTCPETGWWQCADEGAPVAGGSRQLIRQGERMPDVVLLGEPSLWQKVKGEIPQFRRATVWKLDAYPEAPAGPPGTEPAPPALPDSAPPEPTDAA